MYLFLKNTWIRSFLYSILSNTEMGFFLDLPKSFSSSFVLGESSPHCTCLLHSKIERLVFLGGVEFPKIFTLSVSDDSHDTGNRLPHHFDFRQFGWSSARHFGNIQLLQFCFQFVELVH